MNNNMNTFDLIKQNIKQFFSEMKFRNESKKKYRLDKLARNIPMDNGSGYEDFAPESEIKNGEEYIKALHWALKNEEVKNIALSGPYGSGKSSIIQSYLKKHPSTCALNISLATFDWEKKEYSEFKNEVELGILKQLFYKVDSNKIPQSRYHKIHKQYYRHFVWIVAILFFLFSAVIGFFFPEVFEDCIERVIECGNYYHLSNGCSYIVAGVFVILGVLIVSYICKWVITHLQIKEVNIADKATVADKKEEESIFDKNMDEIVYFFEETSYDTVFIEDLDRFDSSEIFVKLRELNTILNNYDLIKRRIVFVYAVKDDMFKDEERTKFFDFIIPVIPIINSTNSGEILRKKLGVIERKDGTCGSSLYDISSSYITLVSPFIEDMRVLTSICNEFIVYKNTLQSLNLKDEEMFSIMIFKNLFPTDFSKLEAEKGIVKTAFDNKKVFVSKMINNLKEQNKELLGTLEKVEGDVLCDLTELKAAFMNFLTGNKGAFSYCTLNGKKYTYQQIMKPDFDLEFLNCTSNMKVYFFYNANGYHEERSIPNLKKEIEDNGKNYLERFIYLKNSEEARKEEIRKEIEDNDIAIMNMRTYSLKSLLEKYGAEDVLSEEVRGNEILVFLLKKGFINENYADYINYFHPNSITNAEMNYIRGIRMEKAVGDFSYRIKNVADVCDRIEDYEFKQVESLNYDVTDYLVTKKNKDEKCMRLFEGLAQGSDKAIEFIKSYVERNQNVAVFIKTLCGHYISFWWDICNNESFSEDSKFKYLSLIFLYASIEDVVNMNEFENKDSIKEFILEKKHALAKLSHVNSEKMIQIIEHLGLFFRNIDIKGADSAVLEYVFSENKYELNISMVTSLFEYKYPEKFAELTKCNYSTICEVADESLMSYIYDHFEEYVKEFVLGQDTNVCEDINAVEDILERLFTANPEICKAVLDKENVIWDDLNNCCKGIDGEDEEKARKVIWNYVLENKMIVPSWNNFICYYACYRLTSELVAWVDVEIDYLIEDLQIENITDEIIKEIFVEDISLETFGKIIKKYKIKEFTNNLNDFTPEKIGIMVEEQYIPFSISQLGEMKKVAPDFVKEYILYNKGEFFDNIKEVSLDLHVIAQLLNTNELDNNEKQKLFVLFEDKDINMELALAIKGLEFTVEKSYVEAAWKVLEDKDKYQLLLNQLDVYSLDEISEKVSLLAPEYQKLSDRSRRHKEYLEVDRFGYNQKLLDKLVQREYLTKVDIEPYYVDNFDTSKKEQRQRFAFWIKKK